MCATWAKRRSSPHSRFRLILSTLAPSRVTAGGDEQHASAACLSQGGELLHVWRSGSNGTVPPTRMGSVGAGVSPPLVGAVVGPTHGPESGFSPETPAISRHKLESIANRLWLGNPDFAGLSWDARDPTFRLPCRRSRVRIPSAALGKACICRPFPVRSPPRRRSAPARLLGPAHAGSAVWPVDG
jgi:hypothetical protein